MGGPLIDVPSDSPAKERIGRAESDEADQDQHQRTEDRNELGGGDQRDADHQAPAKARASSPD